MKKQRIFKIKVVFEVCKSIIDEIEADSPSMALIFFFAKHCSLKDDFQSIGMSIKASPELKYRVTGSPKS